MANYKIVDVDCKTIANIEEELNTLAKEGYIYITHLVSDGKHLIIMEKS